MGATSDDNIQWDEHWTEHKEDSDFSDVNAFDYFKDYLPKDFRVLDVGCGSCKFYPLFKLLGCNEYVGVDFSPTAINLARQKFPELKILLMRVEEIDFNAYFDLAFSNTFLQHTKIDTKKKIIPKLWKALKKDGILVIQEKCDVTTDTTFTKQGWIDFICGYGFGFLKATEENDPRNGFIFKVVKS